MLRLLFLGFLVPASLQAQSAISGTIRQDSAKTPIAGVEILIQTLHRSAITNSAGHFLLAGLERGVHTVLVRAIGYRPLLLRAYLVSDDTLDVDLPLTPSVVELAPLEVTATAVPPGMDEFEQRRTAGFGRFIDWSALRRQENRRLADILADVPGVMIRPSRNGRPYLVSTHGHCPMQIYLDGVLVYRPGGAGAGEPPDISLWNVSDLDGIEIYSGPAETPTSLSGSGGNCGTAVLWSRRT